MVSFYDEPRGESILNVRVNGVLLTPANPNDDTGTPGVLSAEWDDTIARIDLNNCPTWMQAGHSVTIDAGLKVNGVTQVTRQWTGFLLALPGEDPDYLRDKVLVTGATIEVGTPPDNVQQTITAAASLVGADIQPPLPTGVHIEHEVPNDLVWTSERASWLAVQYLQRFGQVPRYPTGEPNRQSIICAGAMYKAARPYQLSAIDVGGLTDEAAIEQILALAGISDYSLIEPEPGWYTLADDAALSKGRPLDMLQKLWELGQLQPVHTKAGVLLMRQVKWGPSPSFAWEYDTTDQDLARILSTTGELEVLWNPNIEKFSTGNLVIPFLQVNGRYFVESVRHVWPERGVPVTRVRAMGGSRMGGTVAINPVATYTYTSIREVFGGATVVIASFDASGSFDPDGSIASYQWTDNQGATFNPSDTDVQVTVNEDTSGWTGPWEVTLEVTDNDALTHSVTITIPYESDDEGLTLPATFVAHNSGASASIDGADLVWNDATGATCISVGAKPADGTTAGIACYGFSNGVIKRTTDACATALTTVYTLASGSPINYIVYDWRSPNTVWAASHDAQILRSDDAGVTWTVFDALRTKLSLAGAISGRRCLGLPAGNAVYWVGGSGAGMPVIAFADALSGSHAWTNQTLTGDIATDFPADATTRIMDFTSPTGEQTVIILEFASGGGGSIQPIYSTTSTPGPSAAYTRATGLTAGLKTGRYVVGDNPLSVQTYHAAFNDRDVWDSTDGVAWTEKSDVMPVGVTPNDALFMADVLTGIEGLFGVYMIAAQNAGGTLGLYKSSDGIDTVDVVRGTGAASTAAPASYQPKMIAVGASVASVTGNGQLAHLGDGGILETFDGDTTWTEIGTAPTEGGALMQLASGGFYYMDELINDEADLYWSPDGVDWEIALEHDIGNELGVQGFDIAADGRVYAVMGSNSAADGDQATKPVTIWRADGPGEAFSIIYTDPGHGASRNSRTWQMHNALTCDKWDANKIFVAGFALPSTNPECWYSDDGGETFNARTSPTDPLPRGSSALDIMQFVANSRILFQGDANDLWYSDDLGDTWTAVFSVATLAGSLIGPYKVTWFNNLVLSATTGSADGEIHISRDNGSTWEHVHSEASFLPRSIEYDPITDRIVYIENGLNPICRAIDGAFNGAQDVIDVTFNVADGPSSNNLLNLAYPR